jgi:RsiW-degrading membrane proteinase PrsW (M82 family)
MLSQDEENDILTNLPHRNYNHETFTDNLTFNNNQQIPYQQNHIPKEYVKTFYYVISLFVIGIILIIFSFIRTKTSKKCPFILGVITFIPGTYFTFQFCRYIFTKNIYIKKEILDNIPQF